MHFVDEQDHVAGVGHFAQHGLQAFFELAAKLRAGDKGAHIERDDSLVFQTLGHVGIDDPKRKTFGNGGFAHAGLADKHGIVFCPTGKHLDHAADFLVAADHRVEFSLPCPFHKVNAVSLEGLKFVFRSLICHPGAAADVAQHLQHFLVGNGIEFQDVFGLGIDFGKCKQQMLGRDELVFHGLGFALGGFEDLV